MTGFEALAEEIVKEFHVHCCKYKSPWEECPPCVCECGAILAPGPTYSKDGVWAWLPPDGSYAPFPDPAERGE